MDIFYHNNYKKYSKVNLSIEKLNKIIQYNSTLRQKENILYFYLYAFKSFFNHSSQTNVKIESINSNHIFIFANKTIEKGEELLIDYCDGVVDSGIRDLILEKHGLNGSE